MGHDGSSARTQLDRQRRLATTSDISNEASASIISTLGVSWSALFELYGFRNSSGILAIFTAIRRASSSE
jgi:hypothetical protein